jgi:hypothetical protein
LVRSVTYSRTCWRSVGHVSSDMDSRSDIARSWAAKALPFKILLLAWRHTQLMESEIAYAMVSRAGIG